jgi:hypothetical protein
MPLRVFPVAAEGGPHFSDDFGYTKPGSSHAHQGIDIFASQGAPVVAPDDGALKLTTDPVGGQVFYVTGSDGVVYYGAHLSAYEGSSRTVAAGDVVGYVGTSGNASGTSPHLHFEMHPGGGPAVDPFGSLSALTPQPSKGPGGGPSSPFDQADADLAALQTKLDAANTLLAADLLTSSASLTGSWLADAINAFQAVGGSGVATVAPDIDGAGQAAATQSYTQQAWLANKQLAAVPVSGQSNVQATSNAIGAQKLAQQIVALYQTAIGKGKAAAVTPRPPAPGPAPGPEPSGKPDLSAFVTIAPGLAGKAVIAAYLAKHPSESFAPLDKLWMALAWALGPEGSFTRPYLGSNNWGSYHATKGWIDKHQGDAGYGMLAFMDHAPAPYIATMRINPSPLLGAQAFLDLVEKDVGDWTTLQDPRDFATRLYVAGYYAGFHPNRTPTGQRPAALAAATLTADDQANIADGAAGVTRAGDAAMYALAHGLAEQGDPAASTIGPPFATLAERLTVAHPPHTLEHARALLAGGAAGEGISLADALAAPGGEGVWLFGPGQQQPVAAAAASSSGFGKAIAITAAAAAVLLGTIWIGTGRPPVFAGGI